MKGRQSRGLQESISVDLAVSLVGSWIPQTAYYEQEKQRFFPVGKISQVFGLGWKVWKTDPIQKPHLFHGPWMVWCQTQEKKSGRDMFHQFHHTSSLPVLQKWCFREARKSQRNTKIQVLFLRQDIHTYGRNDLPGHQDPYLRMDGIPATSLRTSFHQNHGKRQQKCEKHWEILACEDLSCPQRNSR